MKMQDPDADVISRILVMLAGTPRDAEIIDTAAGLAQRLRAELAGFFVEDPDLMRLAGLPFAREVSLLSAGVHGLDPAAMRRALRRQADAARRMFEQAATKTGLTWSFEDDGGLPPTSLVVSAERDLLVTTAAGRRWRAEPPDRLVRRTLARVSCTVWYTTGAIDPAHPVLVMPDSPARMRRVLGVAAQLAGRDGRPLIVLVDARDESMISGLQAWLATSGVVARIQPLTGAGAATPDAPFAVAPGQLLVIGRDHPWLDETQSDRAPLPPGCTLVIVS
jgi:hypothetical protein